MIDFHSHIIPQIDDGSRSMEETISMLREAKSVGFNKIISTSHYYLSQYVEEELQRKNSLIEIANKFYETAGEEIKLILGSEIYITPDIIDLLKENKASVINGTRYVLFELPLNGEPFGLKETIFRLIENGYKPIIAHPERYPFVQDDPNSLLELIDMGVLFQSNLGSIIGIYGNSAKKTVKKLLQSDMIHFLGSDCHRANSIYPKIPKMVQEIEKIIGERRLRELTVLNAQEILNDYDFEAYRANKVKKFF